MLNLKFLKSFCVVSLIFFIPLTSYSKEKAPDKTAVTAKTAKLAIPFIENQGQVKDKAVKFYANTFAGNVYVTEKGEVVYALQGASSKSHGSKVAAGFSLPNVAVESYSALKPETQNVVLKETLIGAKEIKAKGENKAVTKVNYFVGNKKNWKTNIQSWNEVSLGEVYNGVELKLKAYGKNVEKLFIVNPSGKVEDIKVSVGRTKGLKVNEKGELEAATELGSLKFTKPIAYQEIDGKRVEVGCEFKVSSSKSQVKNSKPEIPNISTLQLSNIPTYSFKVASYNPKYPLIIDPLLASTFIGGTGGSGVDNGTTIIIDAEDNVFLTGETASTNYPTTPGVYDPSFNGTTDIFVSKFDNNLTTLLASTFIGGSNGDYSNAMTIDSSGNIFVTGRTDSSDYPSTSGAYDTSNNIGDVFISKLNNSLTTLLASTFIGESNIDTGRAIAIDSEGSIFVAGQTTSHNYPTTPGAYDTSYNGGGFEGDVFISKLNSSLSTLLASTFVGGNEDDRADSISIDSSGNIYITGATWGSNYPTTIGAYDTTKTDYFYPDVFVSKFDNNLTTLLASTFIGGSASDSASSVVIDSGENILVTGSTNSSDYPTTIGAYDTSFNGGNDVFVSKLNSSLSSLLASTFMGGDVEDIVTAIALDSSGDVYLSGKTFSTGYYSIPYPTTIGAYDTTLNGGYYDVFVSKLNNALNSLLSSTYLGGNGNESGNSIVLDSAGNVFVSGFTTSSSFPVTPEAYDVSYNGGVMDVFISKFDNNLSADIPTAITLSSFTAEAKKKKVVLKWETGTEIDNMGFNILRSDTEDGEYVQINKKLIPAKGNATQGEKYKFKDKNVKSGKTYYYKLEDIDRDGKSTLHGAVSVTVNFKKKK